MKKIIWGTLGITTGLLVATAAALAYYYYGVDLELDDNFEEEWWHRPTLK